MTTFRFLAAAAAAGALAVPAAAQYSPQQYQYPQQAYPQQTYPQQGYGYNQGYNQNPIGQIVDQLLGNRYSVSDRQAVRQCASAAIQQSASQYAGNGYNRGYGYNQGYAQTNSFRVTAITSVERRSNGLRVSGTLGSAGGYAGNNGYNHQGYGQGYANRGYGAANLSFRCNVDYRGAVTNVRVRPTMYSQGY
jgi:hypothetical protein